MKGLMKRATEKSPLDKWWFGSRTRIVLLVCFILENNCSAAVGNAKYAHYFLGVVDKFEELKSLDWRTFFYYWNRARGNQETWVLQALVMEDAWSRTLFKHSRWYRKSIYRWRPVFHIKLSMWSWLVLVVSYFIGLKNSDL